MRCTPRCELEGCLNRVPSHQSPGPAAHQPEELRKAWVDAGHALDDLVLEAVAKRGDTQVAIDLADAATHAEPTRGRADAVMQQAAVTQVAVLQSI